MPVLFVATLVAYIFTSNTIFLTYLTYIFIINLAILGTFLKRIQIEIANAEDIDKVISQYASLLEQIEKEDFKSKKLIDLQASLKYKEVNASVHLHILSGLFSNMDTIGNLVAASLFNGSFLFNLHVLKRLLAWKEEKNSNHLQLRELHRLKISNALETSQSGLCLVFIKPQWSCSIFFCL